MKNNLFCKFYNINYIYMAGQMLSTTLGTIESVQNDSIYTENPSTTKNSGNLRIILEDLELSYITGTSLNINITITLPNGTDANISYNPSTGSLTISDTITDNKSTYTINRYKDTNSNSLEIMVTNSNGTYWLEITSILNYSTDVPFYLQIKLFNGNFITGQYINNQWVLTFPDGRTRTASSSNEEISITITDNGTNYTLSGMDYLQEVYEYLSKQIYEYIEKFNQQGKLTQQQIINLENLSKKLQNNIKTIQNTISSKI